MEDIVAVAVKLDDATEHFFLTWGRIQDAVDPTPLAELVLRQSHRFVRGGTPISARVCSSLQEAAHTALFYEGFFSFCQTRIPYGPDYQNWRQTMHERMQQGKELYFLGKHDATPPSRGGTTNQP
jgi:hypothetical protein